MNFEAISPMVGDQLFGIQFPYVLEQFDLEPHTYNVFEAKIIRESPPPHDGPTYTGVSVLYFRFQATPGILRYSFNILFVWSGLLSRTEHALYKLVVPFSIDERALCDPINDLFSDAGIWCLTHESDHVSVSVTFGVANIKAAYPPPTRVMGLHGYNVPMFTLELSHLSDTAEHVMPLNILVAYFEASSELERRNRYLYEFGLYTASASASCSAAFTRP